MKSDPSELARRFRSPDLAAKFLAAYDAVLARWPREVTSADIAGEYGSTRVQVCGPPDARPLVALHGGGCTSAVWFATVTALSRRHRVYAVDQLGDAGLSVPAGAPVRGAADLMRWLDGLLDELGLAAAAFCGHSYGAWLALSYARHRPARVTRLALLDPTSCFAGLRLSYRLHAVPVLARPGAERTRGFLEWEAGGIALEPLSLALACAGAEFRGSKIVMPRRPKPAELQALSVPTLVLLAAESQAHDIRRVGGAAERLLPHARVGVLPGTSHHSLPAASPGRLNQELAAFLG